MVYMWSCLNVHQLGGFYLLKDGPYCDSNDIMMSTYSLSCDQFSSAGPDYESPLWYKTKPFTKAVPRDQTRIILRQQTVF